MTCSSPFDKPEKLETTAPSDKFITLQNDNSQVWSIKSSTAHNNFSNGLVSPVTMSKRGINKVMKSVNQTNNVFNNVMETLNNGS